MGDPFRNWHGWAVDARNQRLDQERLLYAHCRIKERRIPRRVFRHWNYFTVYGRVTSLYSRKELLEQLIAKTKEVEELEGRIETWSKPPGRSVDDGRSISAISEHV